MTDEMTITSLKALFRFPFKDPDGRNRFLVGTALVLAGFFVPIVPTMFVGGYILQVMRRAIEGEDPILPPWEEWGKLAVDGLRTMLVGLVYFLPAMLVFLVGMALYFGGTFYIPLATMPAVDESELALSLPLILMGSMAAMFLSMAIGSLLLALGAAALPIATAHFVAYDKVAAAFRVRQWWRLLRANKLGYFVGWVIVAGLIAIFYFGSMLAYYTLILCCLIPLLGAPVGFYVSLVGAALFGQTYRESAAILAGREEDVDPGGIA